VSDTTVHVRLDGETAAWLAGRADRMSTGSHHQQARTELGLWRTVLGAELRRIRLTLPQARCVADVLHGTLTNPAVASGAGLAYAECYDAFRIARATPGGESYGAKHGVDEQELLDYLATLGPAADHALRDAIARWWAQPDPGDSPEGFAAAGLQVNNA